MLFNELEIISGRFDGFVKTNPVCSKFQMESIWQWFLAKAAIRFLKFEEMFFLQNDLIFVFHLFVKL